MELSDNTRLLNRLYRSAEAGACAINAMCEKCDDDAMKKTLGERLHRYRALEAEISRELRARGETPAEARLSLMGVRMGVGMNLMINHTPPRIAQMVISAANADAGALSAAAQGADGRTAGLARELIACSSDAAREMEGYI